MSEWITSIIETVGSSAAGFIIGILFRKRTGRALAKAKKWLGNDVVTATIVSIQTYVPDVTPVEITEFTREVYEDIKVRIPNPQLHDVFSDGMRIAIPIFGVLRLDLSKTSDQQSDEESREETLEQIKITLRPESLVRFGVREVNMLNDYVQVTTTLFNTAEGLISTGKSIKQNYTIIEFPRLGRFVEEKTFEIDDKDLGTHVQATANKLTLTVSPTNQLAKAAKKYLLI